MADQPPNQTMIQIPQAEYNKLTTENRVLRFQVEGDQDEIKDQSVRIAQFRAQVKEKDLVIQQLKQAAEKVGVKAQEAAEDAARLTVDNDKFEEQDMNHLDAIKKLKATVTRLENRLKKAGSSKKAG